MKIILDAMGGDNAPDAVVRGALEAAKEFGVQIVLVGRGADILASMKAQGWDTLPDGVELANAEDVVDMHCDPAAVVKQHTNSSLVLGARMLAQGGGDAFISAGNTGALLTAATLLVKRIRGIRRAAFSPVLPTKDGHAILIDAGANAECTPEFLLQFGCMGSFYAQKALGIESPRVGLLNNGAEDTKGDPLHREAHQLLKRAAEQGTIHFVGNVEARDVPFGAADVIVADGFSGNVLLKTMDYRETGGSIVIGISRPVIKAHGSSDDAAIRGAIRQAIRAVESGFCEEIRANIGQMILPREEEHAE